MDVILPNYYLSLFILLGLCRCLNIPLTMPGTPAILSRNMKRTSYFDSVILPFSASTRSLPSDSMGCRYPVALSMQKRRKRTAFRATLSDRILVGRWAISMFSISLPENLKSALVLPLLYYKRLNGLNSRKSDWVTRHIGTQYILLF